ncbi:hypothetical protein BSZ36_01950 [Rubricoccus marinus]|uniref:Uncharacterized protein n=1 Tax=Rubricoccus marinus TaxID=716817 RepID=A0A259TWD6_9BACT|nr:hypothetical protein BSZ36_01950 [Rubricoccus marinus]
MAYDSGAYVQAPADDGLAFSYLYDAQPGYYGKKARKRGVNIVAVRVVNQTEAPVTLDRNSLRVKYGANPVTPVRGQMVADVVNQPVWTHLLWGLLNVTVTENDEVTLFLPVGLGIAGASILTASRANGKAERVLVEDELFGLTIPPGGTADGLIYLNELGSAPLSFDYIPAAASGAEE